MIHRRFIAKPCAPNCRTRVRNRRARANTINRYVGKLAGLYPKHGWQPVRSPASCGSSRRGDLKCYLFVRWLKSGALDDIPAGIVDRQAPLLAQHLARVQNHPGIAAYYAARKK